MKKKLIGFISVLLALALFVGLTHMLSGNNKGFGSTDEKIGFGSGNDITELVKEGNYFVTQNDKFSLILDTSGNPIIIDKASGKVWKSINDSPESGGGKFTSSVVAHYLSSNSAKGEYFSSEHAVDKNQMHVYEEQDGVKVEYAFGDIGEEFVYPDQISQKRLEQFLKKMSADDAEFVEECYILYEIKYYSGANKEFLLSQYPRLEKENLYVLSGGSSKRTQRKLDEILRSAGYTLEDKESDNQGNESSTERQCAIRISVSYRLTDVGFSATVDTKDCLFYSEYPLTSIDLLPYFDCYVPKDNGYMVVPEGGGALIYVNDSINDEIQLELPVFGENSSVTELYNSSWDYSLPVFGQYKNNSGYLCIINDGSQQSKIKVERNQNCSTIYPSFDLLDNNGFKIGVQGDVYLTSSGFTTEKVTMEYILFNELEEKTAYSKMANTYREYLVENGVLHGEASENPILLTEFVNAINYDTVAYGVLPVNKEFAMTSFEDVIKISDEISKWSNSENLSVLLTGYNKKGLNSGKIGKISYSKSAGGKKGYADMQEALSKSNINLYLNLDFSIVESNVVTSAKSNLARNINNSIANLSVYDLQTNIFKSSDLRLLSPSKFENLWEKYSRKGINSVGIGVSQFTSSLYGDYADGNLVCRQDSINYITNVLSTIKKENFKILGDIGNLYSLKYLDLINNISLTSSKNSAYDKEIPFVQMVIHGYVDYVGKSNNNSSDTQYNVLKHIETGSGMHYMITANKFDKLFDTDYSFLYDTNYDAVKSDIKSSYLYVQNALKGLGKAIIKEHIYLTDTVVRIAYDTGDVIYINYGDTEYKENSVKINPNSYLRVEK